MYNAKLRFSLEVINSGPFARYVVAGLVNTAVGFLLYAVFVIFFQAPFWLANAAALIGGIVCGFFLAHVYVFKGEGRSLAASGWRYVMAVGAQYIVSTAMIGTLMTYGITEILGYLTALPFMILISFLLQKIWVFKAVDEEDRAF